MSAKIRVKYYGLKVGGHVQTTPTEGGGAPVPDILKIKMSIIILATLAQGIVSSAIQLTLKWEELVEVRTVGVVGEVAPEPWSLGA